MIRIYLKTCKFIWEIALDQAKLRCMDRELSNVIISILVWDQFNTFEINIDSEEYQRIRDDSLKGILILIQYNKEN